MGSFNKARKGKEKGLKSNEYYWFRIGDGDDYHKTKSLDELGNVLANVGDFQNKVRMGIETDKYFGNNYISLFVGDKDAQPTRELTQKELDAIF